MFRKQAIAPISLVELLGKEQIGKPAIRRAEQIHILHDLMDYVVIFRLKFRAAVPKQEFYERIQVLEIALGWIQCKRVYPWAIRSTPLDLPDKTI